MIPRSKPLLFTAILAATAGLFTACVGDYGGGGSVEVVGGDYYGPAYGGPVYYGHPAYRGDFHVASPPERHFAGHDDHRAEASHAAPQQHAAPAPRPSGGGHEGTTPEPRNQHP